MTPQQLQRIQQFQQSYTNTIIHQLFIHKKIIESQLIQQIKKNISLQQQINRRQIRNIVKIQNKVQAQSEQSEYQASSQEINTRNKRNRKQKTRKLRKRMKNDTKNIPKNFGKAIITFIQQNQQLTQRVLDNTGVKFTDFIEVLKQKKRDLYSIAEIRKLWIQNQFEYAKEMRTLSLYFLKKSCLSYIFCSRISNYTSHIKYRNRFIQVLSNPQDFTCIKI